jgi:DNA-binding transcriptional ArsR family regulator
MNILAEILSSKARAEIFRILFSIEPLELHLREIERQSGLAIGTISQETKKLERLELIRKRKDGNRQYYSANKEHPLYKTIRDLVLKSSGLTDILQKSLPKDTIKFAFIFGSIAAGIENAQSDIDLFIIGDIGLRVLSGLLKEPMQTVGREINPHIMTENEFIIRKTKKEHFVTRILESPKLMIIGKEDEFERLGQ